MLNLRWLCSAIALAIPFVAFPQSALADRACRVAEKPEVDKHLWLNERDKGLSVEKNLPFGVPELTYDNKRYAVLVQRDYVLGYDGNLKVPLWGANKIVTRERADAERIDCFRPDPRLLPSSQSTPDDYVEELFDQGHMVPNGDFMPISDTAVMNSFVMSNMSPQYCQFNRGVWRILEGMVRLWAAEWKPIYVVSGSIFDRNNDKKPDAKSAAWRMYSTKTEKRTVAIPSHFFKIVIYQKPEGDLETMSFLLPHDRTDVRGKQAATYLDNHLVKLADVEKMAGIKILPAGTKITEFGKGSMWDYGPTVPQHLVNSICTDEKPQDLR